MKRLRIPLTILVVVLVMGMVIYNVLREVSDRPRAAPTVSVAGLPSQIRMGEPFTGQLAVRGDAPVTIVCDAADELGLVLNGGQHTFRWPEPRPGSHRIRFTATDATGLTAEATWQVSVRTTWRVPVPEEKDEPTAAPTVSVAGLPPEIPAGRPFGGRLQVSGLSPCRVTASMSGVAVNGNEVTWLSPVEGDHRIAFEVTDGNGATATAEWWVAVKPVAAAAAAPAAPSLSVAHLPGALPAGQPFEGTVKGTGAEPLTYSCLPADAVRLDSRTGAFSWTPKATQPGRTHELAFTAADATGRTAAATWVVKVARAPAPGPAGLAVVSRFGNEVVGQVEGKRKLYGRGGSSGTVPPRGYLLNRLRHGRVTYRCEVAADPGLAAAEVDALLAVGAELTDETVEPSVIPLTDAGKRELARRGKAAIKLPLQLWWTVFQTADEAGPINSGTVTWRVRGYAGDADAFAVVINDSDVAAE